MIDAQNFDGLLSYAINEDIGERRKQEFSGSFLTSESSTVRQVFQRAGRFINFADGGLSVVGMMISEVIADVLYIRSGGGRPADTHSMSAAFALGVRPFLLLQ